MADGGHSGSRKAGIILLVVLLAIAVFFLVRELRSVSPEVHLFTEWKGIGRSTPFAFTAKDRRGLRSLSVALEQGGEAIPVLSEIYVPRWAFWRSGPKLVTQEINLGTTQQKQLKDGQANLRIVVQNKNWFSSRTALERTLAVRSRPPAIEVHTGGILYINQAGCEMVLYHVSPGTASSGVRVGTYFFPGFPLPGGEAGERLAFFAFPYDVPADSVPQVVARDDADNEVKATFSYHLFPKSFRHRDIPLTDQFMQATVPAILAHTPELADQGDLLKNFLLVNGTLRRSNRAKIAEFSKQTVPEFLWEGPFLQWSNSAVESQFADYRSYIYQGKKVDEQVHLGFDLAVVTHSPVAASNSGRVVFADYLGIFGNAVILDHGFGLQTLYAHLNSFRVKAGDKVTKGQLIADSDSTGLAGGDHLHFTTLLDGVEVNPVEWWDKLWIDKHIMARLSGGTPPAEVGGQGSSRRSRRGRRKR